MHRKRFITNTVFLFGTSLIAQVIGLFVLPLFIKNLGQELYGLFIISNMLVGYVGLLDFGFTDGLMRQIGRAYSSKDHQGLSDAVSTGFWLLAGVGVLSGLAIYFGRFLFLDFLNVEGSDRVIGSQLLIVTAVFSFLQWPLRLPATILRASLHIKAQSLVQAAVTILSSVTMLALVLWPLGVVGIRIGVCAVLLLGTLPMMLLVRRKMPELRGCSWRFDRKTCVEMSRFSLGMLYTRLLSMLSNQLAPLIIGSMISVAAITPYVIAEKFKQMITQVTSRLFGAVLPTVFSLDTDENRAKLQTLLDVGVRYRALLISPLAYLGIVISPMFLRTWMGEDYVQYAIWAQLFMIPLFSTVWGYGANIARGMGKLRATNTVLTFRVALNVILSIVLIPHFGIGAPVVALCVAHLILGDAATFPWFCRFCNLRAGKAWREGALIIAANAPAAAVAIWVLVRWPQVGWISLFAISGLLLFVFYGTLLLFFVGQSEKQDIMMAFDAIGIKRVAVLRRAVVRCIRLNETEPLS